MIILPPRSTRTDTLCPDTTRFRSEAEHALATAEQLRRVEVEHIEQVCLMERLEERRGMRERFDRLQAPMKRIQENLQGIRQQQADRKAAGAAADSAAIVLAQVQVQLALLQAGAADPVLPLFSEEFPKDIAHKRQELATSPEPAGSKNPSE